MNKIGVCSVFSIIFVLQFALALEDNRSADNQIDRAYQCLESQTNARAALSLQEATFSILALGSSAKAAAKLESEKSTQNNLECWPKAACKVKETAQSLLAYSTLGKNTDKIESYLNSKSGAATGLNWFLLIDINNHEAASCQINYNNAQYTLNIGEDMKLAGSLGSCLSIVSSGYWMQISPSCLDKSYVVSCSKDFITTLLYQKSNSETVYVSPNTHTASSSGTTNETISSRCFKSGNVCDYEGTLWATLALDEIGDEVSVYLPYLVALSSENEKYLPNSFLYKLTNGQDYYSSLVGAQFNNQYWQAPSSPYGKFYDTALALLGLQNNQVVEAENAKSYLLNVQSQNGCWNGDNIRDTAFILYAAWPGQITGPDPGGPSSVQCESSSPQYSCVSSRLSCFDAGGEFLQNYECPGSLFCCSITIQEQSCSQLGGEVCALDKECSGSEVSSKDGSCCLDLCEPRQVIEENQCEQAGGLCKSSCDSSEEESSESCTISSEACCIPAEKGFNWTWIIVLSILIIIVILAIVFRNRLALKLHRTNRSSVSSTPMTIRRPSFPPSSPPMARYPAQRSAARPSPRVQPADKEMEETLRKLKEMSK